MGTLQLERHMMSGYHARLPKMYQECAYIESSGHAYIDTGITIADLTMDIDFSMVGDYSGVCQLAGAYNLGSPNRWQVLTCTANGFAYDIENYNQAPYNVPYDNEKHNILFYTANQHAIYFDDTIIAGSYDSIQDVSRADVYLFCSNGQARAEFFSNARVYYCKMVKNGTTVVREFVPCYAKSTGEAGLYDLVTKQFFGNNNGVGQFTHGADV